MFDLNDDDVVDQAELYIWVQQLGQTWFGDADLNGEFDCSDFAQVFATGKYGQGWITEWNETKGEHTVVIELLFDHIVRDDAQIFAAAPVVSPRRPKHG